MAHPTTRMNKVKMVRGQTKVLQIKVKAKSGRNAKLDGATLYLTVRKSPSSDVIITKTTPAENGIEITDAGNGEAVATLSITDTNIEAGQYRYDLWVEYPGDPPVRQPVVKFAQLEVIDGLTDFT